jgi:hypothetical protein
MAKQVPPDRILQAMEAVTSRCGFAFDRARAVTQNPDQIERLGSMLAESLAAGFKEQDASHVLSRLQDQSATMSPSRMDELVAACLAMARDWSRLGIPSELASRVISNALSNGTSAAGVASIDRSGTECGHRVWAGCVHGPRGERFARLESGFSLRCWRHCWARGRPRAG